MASRPNSGGGKDGLDAVLPLVYPQLRQMASSLLRNERASHTLQPTALVNELYLRMATQHSVDFNNRAQVLGLAAQMMRRILATYAEGRKASKRGGEITIVCLHDVAEPAGQSILLFSVVDEVLNRLAALDARQAQVAELRIFGGLTVEETAEFLDVSPATVSRDWASGKLWLTRELRRADARVAPAG